MAERVIYTCYSGAALAEIYIVYSYSQNIANNTTTITAEARWRKLHSGAYGYRNQGVNFRLRLDGTDKNHNWAFNLGSVGVGATGSITSTSETISHNPDGTLGNIEISVYSETGTTTFGTINGSFSLPITTIPRESSLSVSKTEDLSLPRTFTINAASASFSHKITWNYGEYGGTIYEKGNSRDISWNPLIEVFAPLIPTVEEISIGVTLITYSGDTEIGRVNGRFSATLPASIKPTISNHVVNVGNGYNGEYIQGQSFTNILIEANGVYGSQIRTYTTTFNGRQPNHYSNFSGPTLTNVGNVEVKTQVWDSRGRTAIATKNITVLPYEVPRINELTAVRSNQDGTVNNSGAYIKVVAKGSLSSMGGIGPKGLLRLRYREHNGTWETYTNPSAGSWTPEINAIIPADTEKSYEIEVYLPDYYTSSIMTRDVGTAFTLVDFHKDGKSMAIGKVSENIGVLEVSGTSVFTGKVYSSGLMETILNSHRFTTANGYIELGPLNSSVAHIYTDRPSFYFNKDISVNGNTVYHAGNDSGMTVGFNARGMWWKFPSGMMICTMHQETKIIINIAYGGLGLHVGYGRISFPADFAAPPIVSLGAVTYQDTASWGTVSGVENASVDIRAVDAASRDGSKMTTVIATAVGRWK